MQTSFQEILRISSLIKGEKTSIIAQENGPKTRQAALDAARVIMGENDITDKSSYLSKTAEMRRTLRDLSTRIRAVKARLRRIDGTRSGFRETQTELAEARAAFATAHALRRLGKAWAGAERRKTTRVAIPEFDDCRFCGGRGDCDACSGTGKRRITERDVLMAFSARAYADEVISAFFLAWCRVNGVHAAYGVESWEINGSSVRIVQDTSCRGCHDTEIRDFPLGWVILSGEELLDTLTEDHEERTRKQSERQAEARKREISDLRERLSVLTSADA